MRRRSPIVKRIGACTEAVMVSPTFTWRPITRPSIGDRMMVRSRLTRAWVTTARAAAMSASAPFTSADACSMAVRGDRARPAQLPIDGERLRVLQLQAGVVQDRLTAGTLGLRSREPRFGVGEPRLNNAGSSRAITWPDLTRELKSTGTDAIVPETCEPTSTFRAGSSVPLTRTRRAMGPLVTSVVWT